MFGFGDREPKTAKDVVVVETNRNPLGIYTVYDRVAEECGPVFSARNDGVAMRAFRAMMRDNGAVAGEYKLVRIASYDSISMEVKSESVPVEVTLPPNSDDFVTQVKE